ncbi:MAG: glycosyltransferase, partial [Phycisphaerae bacterium]|nr:glycosyltransferase [Phycisphaerae bacterium]
MTRPLRVLQLANQPGPLVLFERPVCDALRAAGAEVHLACMRVGALSPRLDEMGYRLHDLPAGPWGRLRTWIRLYRRLRRLLRDEQFDVMIVHTPVMSWIARFAARGLVGTVIYLAHGLPFAPNQSPMRYRTYRFIEKRLARYTDAVLVMNQADDEACRQYRLTRTGGHCYKVPGVGVDVSFWAAPPDPGRLAQLDRDLALDADRPVVLFLGRFIDAKRPADVLAVARSVGPRAQFVLAGDGPLWDGIHQQAGDVGNWVRVVPFSDDPHLLVHRSAVVVLPS